VVVRSCPCSALLGCCSHHSHGGFAPCCTTCCRAFVAWFDSRDFCEPALKRPGCCAWRVLVVLPCTAPCNVPGCACGCELLGCTVLLDYCLVVGPRGVLETTAAAPAFARFQQADVPAATATCVVVGMLRSCCCTPQTCASAQHYYLLSHVWGAGRMCVGPVFEAAMTAPTLRLCK
jgi:hypothetical protein